MQLGPPLKRRKPSLTPMIDVVFLLLVFFMLAWRFGVDTHLPLNAARLVPDGFAMPQKVDIGNWVHLDSLYVFQRMTALEVLATRCTCAPGSNQSRPAL